MSSTAEGESSASRADNNLRAVLRVCSTRKRVPPRRPGRRISSLRVVVVEWRVEWTGQGEANEREEPRGRAERGRKPCHISPQSSVRAKRLPRRAPEFTNWRDETQAWQKTCVLFNQSYHMADLRLEGADALKLLTRLGINSVAGFTVDKAKQFVPCNYDGYVIGDVILFYLGPNRLQSRGTHSRAQLDSFSRRPPAATT